MSPKPPDILRKSHAHAERKARAAAKLETRRVLETENRQGFGGRIATRAATPEDAPALATLVNEAGEGLPLFLWERIAGVGEDPWEIGRGRARREEGSFSYRNAVVVTVDDEVVACLIGYPLPDRPEPVDWAELPPMFRPLQELEDLAAGTWYLNVLATLPALRGRGLGRALLAHAEELAQAAHRSGLSLIVSDANTHARRLYERMGYRECATRPMVKDGWRHAGTHWVLLVKRF